MGKNTKSIVPSSHPHLWRWVNEFGTIEIGLCPQTRSFIRVVDEGGIVWKGAAATRRLMPRWPMPKQAFRAG